MSNNQSTAIVLCGGPINYSSLPIATNASNAMIPVNGKPVIGWILDDLVVKGITQVVVVLQLKNKRLFDFITWAYRDRLAIEFAFSPENGTIIDSLAAGLQQVTEAGALHVLLGDTLLRDTFGSDRDFVYVSEVADSRKWCMVTMDREQNIVEYFDKIKTHDAGLQAIAGYYFFSDSYLLKNAVAESIRQHDHQLSNVLRTYGRLKPIQAKTATQWYDFGNIENFTISKRKLLQSRYFNSLHIDGLLGIIIKKSQFTSKLRDELNWYKSLPEKLRVLTPRLVEVTEHKDEVLIAQEYYGYPNLAEIYLFGDLHVDIWYDAINRLMEVHKLLASHKTEVDVDAFERMYIDKTFDRLEEVRNQDAAWQEILTYETVVWGGMKLEGIPKLQDKMKAYAKRISSKGERTVIHGDFCLSNILYDSSNQIVRLIDPRGSFGVAGIWGDPRYDIAKLRHSIHGLYDYVIADLFEVNRSGNQFTLTICINEMQEEVADYFDQKIVADGYSLDEIKFIEGLLFISMLPLHKGMYKRQLAMFINGVRLLNEVLV